MLRSIRVTDQITEVTRTDEESAVLSYIIDADTETGSILNLEAELSTETVRQEMRNFV